MPSFCEVVAIDIEDTTPTAVAELVQERLRLILDKISPTASVSYTVTPLHTSTENISDHSSRYDSISHHHAVLLSVVAVWLENPLQSGTDQHK
jgi:hypothetical protein